MIHPGLLPIVNAVEQQLAAYYGFVPAAPAADHLADRDELATSLGEAVRTMPEFGGRGSVFVIDQSSQAELFIGIYLADEIQLTLANASPLERLTDANLDAFCVLVEEISHFHLILNRASESRGVAKVELEWQGEIDKLLISALVLREQSGVFQIPALATRLFEDVRFTAADSGHYLEASKQAARFWYTTLQQRLNPGPEIRNFLRSAYRASWPEKIARLTDTTLLRAS